MLTVELSLMGSATSRVMLVLHMVTLHVRGKSVCSRFCCAVPDCWRNHRKSKGYWVTLCNLRKPIEMRRANHLRGCFGIVMSLRDFCPYKNVCQYLPLLLCRQFLFAGLLQLLQLLLVDLSKTVPQLCLLLPVPAPYWLYECRRVDCQQFCKQTPVVTRQVSDRFSSSVTATEVSHSQRLACLQLHTTQGAHPRTRTARAPRHTALTKLQHEPYLA